MFAILSEVFYLLVLIAMSIRVGSASSSRGEMLLRRAASSSACALFSRGRGNSGLVYMIMVVVS